MADPADLTLDAAVEVVERLGSEILLDVAVGLGDDGGLGRADRHRQGA